MLFCLGKEEAFLFSQQRSRELKLQYSSVNPILHRVHFQLQNALCSSYERFFLLTCNTSKFLGFAYLQATQRCLLMDI